MTVTSTILDKQWSFIVWKATEQHQKELKVETKLYAVKLPNDKRIVASAEYPPSVGGVSAVLCWYYEGLYISIAGTWFVELPG